MSRSNNVYTKIWESYLFGVELENKISMTDAKNLTRSVLRDNNLSKQDLISIMSKVLDVQKYKTNGDLKTKYFSGKFSPFLRKNYFKKPDLQKQIIKFFYGLSEDVVLIDRVISKFQSELKITNDSMDLDMFLGDSLEEDFPGYQSINSQINEIAHKQGPFSYFLTHADPILLDRLDFIPASVLNYEASYEEGLPFFIKDSKDFLK
ncbi:MAG: hypothetical protein ACMXX6_00145 [Candidatus Woesearchaeota archaeon]